MLNCVPDIILGAERRNGLKYVSKAVGNLAGRVFHTYDRGDGDEQYIFITGDGGYYPLQIFDKYGVIHQINYLDDPLMISDYISGNNLVGLTVQDTTFIANKDKKVEITEKEFLLTETFVYISTVDLHSALLNSEGYQGVDAYEYAVDGNVTVTIDIDGVSQSSDSTAIYKVESSGFVYDASEITKQLITDTLNKHTYEIIDGNQIVSDTELGTITLTITFSGTYGSVRSTDYDITLNTKKKSGTSQYEEVAYYWLKRASNDTNNPYRYAVYLNGVLFDATGSDSEATAQDLVTAINGDANYNAIVEGSVIKIYSTLPTFTFSSWDSWGNQASICWKGKIAKLSDLPASMPWDDVIVKITGNDKDDFTDYFVKSEDGVWIETRDPNDNRGTFINMPIQVVRNADGEFDVSFITWEVPHVGNEDTNLTPSFVGNTIQDVFFFKNRLGFASSDSIIMSEEGGYYNFYSKTAIKVLDTDPIDITIASNQASRIYFVAPFQSSLYVFTKDSQLEATYNNTFSPLTVSLDVVSNYDVDTNVRPIVTDNSLMFISTTADGRSQLREYMKDEDKLVVKGIDLTINRPTMLPKIDEILVSSALGLTVMYSETTKNTLYLYKQTTSDKERVQSALFRWNFSIDIEDIFIFDKELYITYYNGTTSYLLKLPILPVDETKVDIVDEIGTAYSYESKITLPKWYPKLINMKTPIDNVQIKKVNVDGIGTFNVDIYRESYNHTTTRTYSSGSTKDFSASVAGRSKDTVISIKNSSNEPFKITSITLEGLYKQSSRELR